MFFTNTHISFHRIPFNLRATEPLRVDSILYELGSLCLPQQEKLSWQSAIRLFCDVTGFSLVSHGHKMDETSRLKVSDDLVQKVSLHIPLPTLIHGYSLPFIFLYGAWFYLWVFVYGVDEHLEAGWLALAVIGIIQILVSLSCYWSVHVRTLLTCSATDDPLKAVLAKVIPTPNNGSSQLVFIRKSKV